VNRLLKVPTDEQPTANPTSVTLRRHDAAAAILKPNLLKDPSYR
jgi:hypothetical protein